MRNANNLGLLIVFISLAGIVVAVASLMQHIVYPNCVVLMMYPEKVVCTDLFTRIVPDLAILCPNLVGLVFGLWLHRDIRTFVILQEKQTPNRTREERDKTC